MSVDTEAAVFLRLSAGCEGGDFTSLEAVDLDSHENGLVSLREAGGGGGGAAEEIEGLEEAEDQGTEGRLAANPFESIVCFDVDSGDANDGEPA